MFGIGLRCNSVVFWLALLGLAVTDIGPGFAATPENSCVQCHSDKQFLVTNKKLYDYFQYWQRSVHKQEDVSCADCHGGDPSASDKARAHGRARLGAGAAESPVNYRNIPATCANCHPDIYGKYRQSNHFKQLMARKGSPRGPNCVTCHGSVNLNVLNLNTVRETCLLCHNARTANNPDIPARAEKVLSEFLSIHRFYRYFTKKGQYLKERETFDIIDARTTALFIDWHTFDLPEVERKTRALLDFLKVKRNEIRERLRESRASSQ